MATCERPVADVRSVVAALKSLRVPLYVRPDPDPDIRWRLNTTGGGWQWTLRSEIEWEMSRRAIRASGH